MWVKIRPPPKSFLSLSILQSKVTHNHQQLLSLKQPAESHWWPWVFRTYSEKKVFTMFCMSKISCYEKWKIIYFCNSVERNPFFALDRKANPNPIYGSCYSKMEKTANGPLWSTTCATLDRLCIKCNKKITFFEYRIVSNLNKQNPSKVKLIHNAEKGNVEK